MLIQTLKLSTKEVLSLFLYPLANTYILAFSKNFEKKILKLLYTTGTNYTSSTYFTFKNREKKSQLFSARILMHHINTTMVNLETLTTMLKLFLALKTNLNLENKVIFLIFHVNRLKFLLQINPTFLGLAPEWFS